MKKFLFGFVAGMLFLSAVMAVIFLLHKKPKQNVQITKKCNFEILDLKEYKGEYSPGSNYIIYEGIIKNKSEDKEYLKGMVAKIYNQENILISDGFENVNNWIEPNKAMPFKINTQVDTAHNTVIRKYFNKDTRVNPDIYPWFNSCK